ncbi:hypothetical protein D3C76_1163150 [compost metagenome]
MVADQGQGGGAPGVGGAAQVQAGEVLGITDADRAQAVLQALVVEAHAVQAGDGGGDVGTGLLGHAILVGIAVVLAPVPLDVELEALVGLTVEADLRLPLIVGDQGHGQCAPAVGGATEVQGRQHAGVAAVAVGDVHGGAGAGGQPLCVGDGQSDGVGAQGIELDCLGLGAAAGGPAVAHHTGIIAGG